MEKTYVLKTVEETQGVAEELAKTLKAGDILCLYGNLGAGKTTFSQGLARGLGITQRIISPTFVIVRKYEIKRKTRNVKQKIKNEEIKFFYHIDLYRTKTRDDLKGIGIEEILRDTTAIVAIEWAEKLGTLLPRKRLSITLAANHDDSRTCAVRENNG